MGTAHFFLLQTDFQVHFDSPIPDTSVHRILIIFLIFQLSLSNMKRRKTMLFLFLSSSPWSSRRDAFKQHALLARTRAYHLEGVDVAVILWRDNEGLGRKQEHRYHSSLSRLTRHVAIRNILVIKLGVFQPLQKTSHTKSICFARHDKWMYPLWYSTDTQYMLANDKINLKGRVSVRMEARGRTKRFKRCGVFIESDLCLLSRIEVLH